MTKVIKFPSRQTRDWASFERNLKIFSTNSKLSAEAEAVLISRMRPFFDLVNIQISFPDQDNSPEVFDREMTRCVAEINEFAFNLIKDRLDLELERLVLTGVVR